LRDSNDHCCRVLDPQLASRRRGVPSNGLSNARHSDVLPAALICEPAKTHFWLAPPVQL
jgi:hypothetical protein